MHTPKKTRTRPHSTILTSTLARGSATRRDEGRLEIRERRDEQRLPDAESAALPLEVVRRAGPSMMNDVERSRGRSAHAHHHPAERERDLVRPPRQPQRPMHRIVDERKDGHEHQGRHHHASERRVDREEPEQRTDREGEMKERRAHTPPSAQPVPSRKRPKSSLHSRAPSTPWTPRQREVSTA